MKRLLLSGLALFLVVGCRTAAVFEVRDAIVATNTPNHSKEDVRKAIVRAGASLGWQISDNGPDALVGTLNLRQHIARVDIPYSAKSYSLLYKDSTNLKAGGGTIHSNYNGWIQNLNKNIVLQLNAL